jgi:hypothetical protein
MSGLSNEILRQGSVVKVQTEDKGPRTPVIESHIYRQGRLLHSRKTSYLPLLGGPDSGLKILRLMKDQHQALLDDIAAGRLDRHLFNSTP